MQIRHVGGACAWARRHRPIPKDFATFLTSHMNIDDIERVVGRRDKAELGETESEEIDCAKLLATRLMVDMYAPRKQFPFTTKWNNRGEPCEGDRLHTPSREQTYFRGSKVDGVGGTVVRFLHLTRVDLGDDAWLQARVDAKSGISQACLWLQATVGTPCCRHFGHIEYVVGIHEINELITQSDVHEWDLYFVARDGGKEGVVFWKYALVPKGHVLQEGREWLAGGKIEHVLGELRWSTAIEVVNR